MGEIYKFLYIGRKSNSKSSLPLSKFYKLEFDKASINKFHHQLFVADKSPCFKNFLEQVFPFIEEDDTKA